MVEQVAHPTISTLDFYQRYFRKNESSEHYLRVTRLFTVVWAVLIIILAFIYVNSEGSILQTLSKIGSYFVGAKLSMFGLGFFSKQATEKGLLERTAGIWCRVRWTVSVTCCWCSLPPRSCFFTCSRH